eukprot:CAMPEP_0170633424 /NCGR_PEP_ID=MMETSP0224-20130122/35973_1 /TAXON_ID=285029 /ORGANISM="Togula jolla, Strain CCCM 725" /LENGTH=63 /DNA_ID=CAMNT_0010962441 /DNA_START=469 /DNA_END=660 /DNA_ORIENTATION=+
MRKITQRRAGYVCIKCVSEEPYLEKEKSHLRQWLFSPSGAVALGDVASDADVSLMLQLVQERS